MKNVKYIHLVFAILFVLFAAVQLNDPDSGIWMSAYSAAAFISILSFLGKMPKKVLLLFMGVVAISIGVMFPNTYSSLINYDPNLIPNPEVTHTSDPQTEIFKEVGGLIVILVAFIIQYLTIEE
ncbi:MAG: transmembrane 220 family protein [Saprospiraceae bacterium]